MRWYERVVVMQLVWRMLEPVVQMQIGMWCAVALLTPRCTFLRLDVRTSTAHNLFLQGVTIARVLMQHVRVQQRKQGRRTSMQSRLHHASFLSLTSLP
jgi:ABC-type microcin C transport system permease subunit YejB